MKSGSHDLQQHPMCEISRSKIPGVASRHKCTAVMAYRPPNFPDMGLDKSPSMTGLKGGHHWLTEIVVQSSTSQHPCLQIWRWGLLRWPELVGVQSAGDLLTCRSWPGLPSTHPTQHQRDTTGRKYDSHMLPFLSCPFSAQQLASACALHLVP